MKNDTITAYTKSAAAGLSGIRNKLLLTLLAPVIALSLAGCNGNVFASLIAKNNISTLLPYLSTAAVESIDIVQTPSTPSVLPYGMTRQLTVRAHYSDGSIRNLDPIEVAWTPDISNNVLLDPTTGIVTGKLISPGTATITADYAGKTATVTINLDHNDVLSVTVNAASSSIPKGTTLQLTATGNMSDGTTMDITNDAGTVWSVNSAGTVTMDYSGTKGLAYGTTPGGPVTVTAAYKSPFGYGSFANTAPLSVTNAILDHIVVNTPQSSIAKGTYVQLSATGVYSDNSTQDLTSLATWTSADVTIADVSDNSGTKGYAFGSGQGGPVNITASYGGKSASQPLTVTNATLNSITINAVGTSIAKGTTMQYTATGTYSDGSTQNLTTQATWTSSAPAIAPINSNGLASGSAMGGPVDISASMSSISSNMLPLTVTAATLVSVTMNAAGTAIAKGTTIQYSALGTYSDGSTQDLTAAAAWSSTDGTVASVNSSGLATGNNTGGPVDITAAYDGKSDTMPLTVSAATLVSITVNAPGTSIAKGTTIQFSAIGTYTDGSTQDLTGMAAWTSTDGSTASVNAGGLATGNAVGGPVDITASYGGHSDTAPLTVTAAVLNSINVTAALPSIPKGTTQQYTATGVYSDGTNQDLTGVAAWSSGDNAIASLSAGGLATGNAVGGPVNITATYGGKSGSSPLSVTAAQVVSVAVSPASDSIAKGTTLQFSATGTFTDGSSQDLTAQANWTSGNSSTASVNTSGLATGNAVGGPVTITATYDGQSGTAQLSVTAAVLTSVTVAPGTHSMARLSALQYAATGNFSDGSTQDVTGLATWASNSNTIASIDSAGRATGQNAGTATITAAYGGQSGTASLTINPSTLTAIQVTPAMPAIGAGASLQFSATGIFDDGTTQNLTTDPGLTWSSSDTGKATISNTAGSNGLATTIAAGTTLISAQKSGITGSTTLTVAGVTLQFISISAPKSSIANGTSVQFTATGIYSDNSTQDLTAQVLWNSSNGTAASISNTAGSKGLASALNAGSTNITAAKGAITSGTYVLTVTSAALSSIAITPTDPVAYVIAYGTTQQFTAIGTFDNGTTQDITGQVDWTSSISNVATIDANGLSTTTINPGSTVVTANYPKGGPYTVTASTNLEVRAITLSSITVTPSNSTSYKGQAVQFYATGTYADGTVMDLTRQVLWSSDNTAVADVSNATGSQGLVSSIAAGGPVTITATRGSVSGSTALTVTATDTVQPTMTLAQVQAGNKIMVTFSKPMDFARATTPAYYKVMLNSSVTGQCSDNSNFAGTGLTINSVTLYSQTQYILNMSSGTNNALYTVIGDKNNLRDVAGNTMACSNTADFMGIDTIAPYLVSVINPDNAHITVNYSEPMTAGQGTNAADNTGNYVISPAVSVSSITTLSSSSFRLNLASTLAPSTLYTVTVATNVTDQASSPNAMGLPNALSFMSAEGLKVVSAVATDVTHAQITFNKPVSVATAECSDAASCGAKYKLFPNGDLGSVTAAARGTGNATNIVTLTHSIPQMGLAYTVAVANARNGDGFDNGANRIESEASSSDYVGASPLDRATFIGKGQTIVTISDGAIFDDPFADLTSFNFAFVYGGRVYLGPNQRNENAFRFDPNGYNSVLTTFHFSAGTCSSTLGFGYISGSITTAPVCGTNSGPNSEVGLVGFNSAQVTISATNYEFLVAGPLKNGVSNIYYTQDLDTILDWQQTTVTGTNGINSKSVQTIYATDNFLFTGISSDHNTNAPVLNRYTVTAPGGVINTGAPTDLSGKTIPYLGKQAGGNSNPASGTDVVGIDSFMRFYNALYLANNGGVMVSSNYANATPTYALATPSGFTGTTKYMPASNTTDGGGLGKVSPGKKGIPILLPYNGKLYMARNVAAGATDPSDKQNLRGELWVCNPGADNICQQGEWTRIITGAETDLAATGANAISLLQNNGSGVLYVGFDGPSGASVWRIASAGPAATSGTMSGAGWTQDGATGLGQSLTAILSQTTISDGTYNYLYITAGDGSTAIRVFRQRD